MSQLNPGELWSHYVSHFSFTQLGWLFSSFQEEAESDFISDLDVLSAIIEEWLKHQWPAIIPKPNDEFINAGLARYPLPLDFHSFVAFLWEYQMHHIELEEHAGFAQENVEALREIYDEHNCSTAQDGIKGKALFAVLDDLDIKFHSKEERTWYVETVTRFDRDSSGTINFGELCQIIRKVVDMEEERTRRRQFELIKQSGLPFHEVEDWNALFISKDEAGQGEMMLTDVKTLITGLGVKWDREMSDQIQQWIGESDENRNGTIDFGEFCLVISKMWAANLHDVRGAARDLLVKDRTVSLKSVHNTFLASAKDGTVTAKRSEALENETFIMKRLESGCICLLGRNGKMITVAPDGILKCDAAERGQEFKITTLEDERILLSAGMTSGGDPKYLFVNNDGEALISDGNPADAPYTVFSLVSHEELHKKCWSKSIQLAKQKGKNLAEARKNSKSQCVPLEDPTSPGKQTAIDDLDAALDAKALNSGRGAFGIGPPR